MTTSPFFPLSPAQERSLMRERARNILRAAVRAGRVIKEPCPVCGPDALHVTVDANGKISSYRDWNMNVQAHHLDYRYPLWVVWLCKKHHAQAHRWLREVVYVNPPWYMA
jgi:hypothetical protein